MLAYVTGASGFVGTWLVRHLEASGDDVVAADLGVDVTDGDSIASSILVAAPEVVYHLAGFAHVGESWRSPARAFTVNALGTLNVLQAAGRCQRPPRVLVVSSSEVYGRGSGEPIDESCELRPITPYAASKVAAEYLALQAYLGEGLDVVRVRPFNHVGPGQSETFVVSALAKRVADAERTGGAVAVGNLTPVRDFTDVRDVVRAYRMLAGSGEPGAVYNVASGRGVSVQAIADHLVALAATPVHLEQDPSLVRAVDIPVIVGDSTLLRRATGWEPELDLATTLADVLEHWRSRLA